MQTQSRRGFIGTCAAGLVALGVDPAKVLASEQLGVADFQAMVGSRFYLAGSSVGGKVKLVACNEISSAGGVSQFDVKFRGFRSTSLADGQYSVTNWSGHPNFEVFIKRVGVDSRGREIYLANFAQM